MSKSLPPPVFQTGNCKLATAMTLSGIPWRDNKEPVLVDFNADYLFANGAKTVKEARAKKKPGICAFEFQHSSELKDCATAYNSAQAAVKAAFENGDPVDFLEQLPQRVRAEIVGTVFAIYELVKESRFKAPYWMTFPDEGEVIETSGDGGSRVESHPGFKRIRSDAPESLKKEMGLL
jgi:hypothetical protein